MTGSRNVLIKIGYIIFIFIFFSTSLPVSAHPGRLDANGGHWDRKNGTYHYHDGSSRNSSSNSTSSDSNNEYATPIPVHEDEEIEKITEPESDDKNETDKVIEESIIITNKPTELFVGDIIRLKTKLVLENMDDKTVDWSTSDDEIATIDSNGTLTAHSAGTVTISAVPAAREKLKTSDEFKITIKPFSQKSIKIPFPNNIEIIIKVWEIAATVIITLLLLIAIVRLIIKRKYKT